MSHRLIAILSVLIAGILLVPNVLATPVPLAPSPWYAVAHIPESDTLHFINNVSQQATIYRPTWTDEDPNFAPRLHITPDGRTLIQVVKDLNGREQIGFYDLETGTMIASHEAQLGERFIWSDDNPSALFANRFAIGLSAPDVNFWRILVFDTTTGAALDELTVEESGIQMPANQWVPYVLHYAVDEGLAQLVVNFQMRNAGQAFGYEWVPEMDPDTVDTGIYHFSPDDGFDIDPVTDVQIFAQDNQEVRAALNGQMTVIATESSGVTNPVWLNQGQWMAYYYNDGVFAPHWRIGPAQANSTVVPLGPNLDAIYSTSDGFLVRDPQNHALMHSTALPEEGFMAQIGNIIFNPGTDFDVIYVTPRAAFFNLESVFYDNGGIVDNNLNFAAPECANSPQSRMAVGMRARVTFTDGTPLRVRTAPQGDIVTEIPEGTQFDIIGGAECGGGYRWWQIQLDNAIIGWSAEGAGSDYFMEQVITGGINVAPQPTPTQSGIIVGGNDVAPQPTATLSIIVGGNNVAPRPTLTPTQMGFVVTVVCSSSPESRLSVGDLAHTDTSGTLALRTNIGDATPSYQVQSNVTVTILEGPRCADNGQRMWRVRTTVNGQQVEGWLAEGWQSTYFLAPGPARASN